MAVDVNSEEGLIIRKLIPLATLPIAHFKVLCDEATVEETENGFLFQRGEAAPRLVYLLSGEVILQAEGLVVEVIVAGSDSARFALAHQIPRKIDAVANGKVRFLRLDVNKVSNLSPPPVYHEDNSYMVIEETDNSPDDWMSALLRSPIFQRLPPANLQKILMALEAVHFKPGEVILEQGSTGDYYYLIKSGQCVLTRKPSPNAKEIKLAQLSNGDTFGEDALLSGATRNVTITALTDIVLLRLDKQRFITLIKEPSLKFVDYEGLQEAVSQGALLLDVRSNDDYGAFHLEGSVNAPFFSLRMQLKSLNQDKPVVVVCQDGKTSEAAAFLLMRHKINAKILQGGMNSISQKIGAPSSLIDSGSQNEVPANEQSSQRVIEKLVDIADDDLVKKLKQENAALKNANQQLNDKCLQLEFDKQNAEKQVRILNKQLEKMTLVLDKLKNPG